MDKEKIMISCPQCGNKFYADKPTDTQPVHTAVCTGCGKSINIKLNHVDIKPGEGQDGQTAKPPQIDIPTSVPGHKHIYVYKEYAETGNTYTITCPECKNEEYVTISVEGTQKWMCKGCGATIAFKAKARKPTLWINGKANQDIGELTWRQLLVQKTVRLKPDCSMTIGRQDEDYMSDISVHDKYMSRRSAKIETIRNDKGYLFKFTVMKTTNPIFVNGHSLIEGGSVYLNYGDTIMMGKTRFTFRKSKKR